MAIQSTHNKRLLKNHDTLMQWIQHTLNAFAVVFVLLVCAMLKDNGEIQQHYRLMAVFSVLVMIITYHAFGVHRRLENILGGIQQLARAWGVVVIVLAWLAFLTKTSEQYSRQVIVYWAVLSFIAQATIQVIVSKTYKLYSVKFRERIPTLVVGTGLVAQHLVSSINRNTWLRDKIIGIVAIDKSEFEKGEIANTKILGMADDLNKIVSKYSVRRVYLAPKFDQNGYVRYLQESLIDLNIDLVWAPDIFEFHLLNHSVREVAGIPLITLNETPLMSGGPAFIKMLMDKITAIILIFLLSPLFILIAIGVKITSEGPIIFKQKRGGWDGKKFNVYKFRSMYVHEENGIVTQARKGDSRITPFGSFLRKSSLDELPQLFNILNGSMSLVGPRPHAESHDQLYSSKVNKYLARHRIKPGMTGLAQINGLRGETETLESMERRVEFDLEYISNWSPLLDIKILLLTPIALLSKNSNAY